jgi:primary-amine oxidase
MRLRRLLAAVLVTVPLAAIGPAGTDASAEAASGYCSGDSLVHRKLAAGTQWQMCWHIDDSEGLVLDKVAFQGPKDRAPLQVLNSIAPVQMQVPYDMGTAEFEDLIGFGFGRYASDMTAAECPGGQIVTAHRAYTDLSGRWVEKDQPVLCVREMSKGLAYRSKWHTTADQPLVTAQGTVLSLSVLSAVGNYEYETRYQFADSGQIDAALGATGEVNPSIWTDGMSRAQAQNYGWPIGEGDRDYSGSHYHSAVWRVDFGIGGKSDMKVEQSDTAWTGRRGGQSAELETRRKQIRTESLLNIADRRAWRVYSPSSRNADGHPRGYDIVFGKNDTYPAHPSLRNALAFTRRKTCEQLPMYNNDVSCANETVMDYADGEALTDPIAWVNVGFHHIVRDEDQSPMPVHWQGFTLYPHDFSAQSPLTPASRADRNGFVATENEQARDITRSRGSTTTLALAGSPIPAGSRATVTVRVRPKDPAQIAAGVLTVKDGGTTLVVSDIRKTDHGRKKITLPALPAGTHPLTVAYGGSAQVGTSTSAAAILTVTPPASTAAPATPAVTAPTPREIAYVTQMAEHHRQALRLVEILRDRGEVPYRIGNLADRIAAEQAAEVTDMTAFLKAWGREPAAHGGTGSAPMPDHHAHMSGMLSQAQVRSLERVSGAAAGRLFLQLMILHHRGAIEMSAQVLPAAGNPWVISLARHVITGQRAEIDSMRRILEDR